jgi:hypothetical protein
MNSITVMQDYKCIRSTIYAERLQLELDNDPALFPSRNPALSPVDDAEDEYEIESIRDHHKTCDRTQYQSMLKWRLL